MKDTMYIRLSHVNNNGTTVYDVHEREVAHSTEAFYSVMNLIMMEYSIPLPSELIYSPNLTKDGEQFLADKEQVPDIPLEFFLTSNTLYFNSTPNSTKSDRGNSKIRIDFLTADEYQHEIDEYNRICDEWDEIQAEGMGHPYPVREKSEHQKILEEETAKAFGRILY
ncbi:hypothetical protein EalM132_00184 [Exiguobacterium phage vB_EalM-132]|nr:hypothetical protein EalM132_00014 [Exiguobacterium phage vB_EalM-132]AYP68696.1 hypothetical protein EalM132_00184 [Exiguobacterium phage vB_EalM-132]